MKFKLKKCLKAFLSGTAAVALFAASASFPYEKLPTVIAAESSAVANPVIWSDVPDLDAIRVGDTYYMISTTMFFSPGAPIMKSKDLASWEICSYVYDTLADGDVQNLTNGKNDYAHGQWAASLRYHKGTYYVFFGSYGTGKSYIYKTNDIENGKWTKTELNGMYHDASLFFDDDGRNYLVYGAGGTIKIKEFNSEMTDFKPGGAEKTLFSTGLDGLSGEGSHIQKIGDYYYIFLIAWPSNSGRIELCYRSKDILGNYEGKTILNSDGAAQGGIIDTPDGKWYGLVFQDHGAVGRIPVLVPVTWQNDWPIMGENGKVPKKITVDGNYEGTFLAADDDFNYSSNDLALEWQWNHNPDNTAWSVTERKGYLRLKNKTIATNILNARNTLTQRTEGPACSSVIKLDTSYMKAGDHAGLSAFQYKYGNVGVYVADDGAKKIYMSENGIAESGGSVSDSYNKIIEETNLNGNEIYLKVDFKFNDVDSDLNISYNLDKANFYYSYDGSNWTKIGSELKMSYDLKLFTGYRSAIYSYATKNTGGYADVDFFDYERADWNQPAEIKPNSFGWYFNNGFDKGTEGWTGRGSAEVLSTDLESYVGGGSLYVSGRTAAWNGAQKSLSSSVFKPGNEYSFSANVKYNDGNAADTFFMKLQYVDGNGDTNYATIAETMAFKGEWAQLSNTNFIIPSDAENMYLYVETADSTNSFYLDEAIVAVAGTGILGAGSNKLVLGDINYDGKIDCYDLILARQGIIGGFDSSAAKAAADVDQNGVYDENDLVLLQNFLLSKITEFPVADEQIPDKDNPWDTYQETASAEMQNFYSDSIYQLGNTSRICEKIEKAQNGENVTLAYIGGSITEGGRTDTCYVSRSAKYFADTFGTGGNVSFINAGLSGTSSVVGLMRAQNDILNAEPDVIFIEFSVNDHPEEIYKKGYESLVKKCLSQSNEPAVILIINRAKGGYSMQEQMSAIGKNYDLSIISMDNALTNAFNSGFLTKDDYYTDEYHPHEKGNALISDSIAYFYRQALKTANKSYRYTIPSETVYGTEYSTGSIVSLSELTNFDNGSFAQTNSGYATLPYTLKHNVGGGNTPIKFSTQGKGIFIVFSAKDDASFGNINVTVNGRIAKISGNKLYAWGGPEADIAYMQKDSGNLDVSINVENPDTEFTIWGIGVVK